MEKIFYVDDYKFKVEFHKNIIGDGYECYIYELIPTKIPFLKYKELSVDRFFIFENGNENTDYEKIIRDKVENSVIEYVVKKENYLEKAIDKYCNS